MKTSRQTKLVGVFRGFRVAGLVVAMICTLAFLSQTVFAQNTFVITDGMNIKTHHTYETDPAVVLDEAGVVLDEDDVFSTEQAGGIYEITIRRNHTVTIEVGNSLIQVESFGETVGELLDRLGVELNADAVLSAPADSYIHDGMYLTVDYKYHDTQTYTEVIPFTTKTYEDPSLPAGVEAVIIEGRDGQVERTSVVTYLKGQETGRVVITEKVLEAPVEQLVAIGTGEAQNVEAQGGLIIGDGIIITADGQVLTYSSTMQVLATAYTHTDEGCDMTTATMTTVRVGTVAVDPTVIPYGTRMFIVTNDGAYVYGIATAEDCGSAIKNARVDLYFPTDPECWAFGRRDATIYFLG